MMSKFTAGLVISGALIAGCGSGENIPNEITEAHTETLLELGCETDPAPITIGDIEQDSAYSATQGVAGIAIESTSQEGIELQKGLPIDLLARATVHATVHWCAFNDGETTFERPIDLENGAYLMSTKGFRGIVKDLDGSIGGNFSIDESVNEWITSKDDNYLDFSTYSNGSNLTERIAQYRNLDRMEIMRLYEKDDLIGYIALLKNKPDNEVTGNDINTIFVLYDIAFDVNNLPVSDDDLHQVLDIPDAMFI